MSYKIDKPHKQKNSELYNQFSSILSKNLERKVSQKVAIKIGNLLWDELHEQLDIGLRLTSRMRLDNKLIQDLMHY
jgi:hypothetical protein